MTPLQSLIAVGTKVWLDSVDPDAVARNRAWGATGATSNPIIVKELIETGQFDAPLARLLRSGAGDEEIAWQMTDLLVRNAQEVFALAWDATHGDDGYVSFELDPLLEDPDRNVPPVERTRRYVELGKKWSAGHTNRMIKVPNTDSYRIASILFCSRGL
jgi:transaldolase